MQLPLARARQERKVAAVLSREMSLPALSELVSAMQQRKIEKPLEKIAIGLDANIFLTLGGHARGAEVADYLASQHSAPLILPGQVIQEFWNNQLGAVDTLYAGVKKKLDPLRAEVAKIDTTDVEYLAEIEVLLEKFGNDYGSLYGAETRRATASLLDVLNKRAIVTFVSRRRFSDIAANRKRTKTPPGFKDDGDGDFYVWADFLLGLAEAKSHNIPFDKAVMVTNDRKVDWVRDEIAHPILAAELFALFSVPFEIWTISQLVDAVSSAQTS